MKHDHSVTVIILFFIGLVIFSSGLLMLLSG